MKKMTADQARQLMRQEARARQKIYGENYATALLMVRAARVRVALMAKVGLSADDIAFVTHVPVGSVKKVLGYMLRRGLVKASKVEEDGEERTHWVAVDPPPVQDQSPYLPQGAS